MTKSSDYKLRAHHSLCIQFFEGRGYSEDFVREMTDIIGQLNEYNPEVIITDACDIICEICPNNIDGKCTSGQKAGNIDRRCLEIYGISSNSKISWKKLKALANDRIISENRLKEVCGDCQWADICTGKI